MNAVLGRIAAAVIVVVCVAASPVMGQSGVSIRVTAEAEPMEVQPGDRVLYTIRVQGASSTVVQTPTPPTPENLALDQHSPNTRYSTSFEGGPGGVAFTWTYRAQESGTARIGPTEVVVLGETHRTQAIRVRVGPRADRRDAPTLTRPEGETSATLDSRDLFIRANPSARGAYQNEQVTVEYRLFYRPGIRLRHSRLAEAWDAPSFWREELEVASRPVPRTRRAYGEAYETIVLKRVALFPTRPGTLEVDPLRIETEAQGAVPRSRGPAVRSRFEPVELASRSVSLDVRELPEPAPAAFDGAVGDFGMSVRTDRDTVAVGNRMELMIQIRGAGNLATLSAPALDIPDAFEEYEPSVETNIDRSGQRIAGAKTFTYTLVPREGGQHELPAVEFAYFDPEARQYEMLRSQPSLIRVTGTAAAPVAGRTREGLPVGDITSPEREAIGGWVRTSRTPLYRRLWPYLALLLPLLAAGGGVMYRRRRDRAKPPPESSPDGALDAAEEQLRAVHRGVQNGAQRSVVYDGIERALTTFLDERLDGMGPGVPQVALDRHLERRGVPEEVREALSDVLDRCGEGQFAPGSAAGEAPERVLNDAASVVRRLDRHL